MFCCFFLFKVIFMTYEFFNMIKLFLWKTIFILPKTQLSYEMSMSSISFLIHSKNLTCTANMCIRGDPEH